MKLDGISGNKRLETRDLSDTSPKNQGPVLNRAHSKEDFITNLKVPAELGHSNSVSNIVDQGTG